MPGACLVTAAPPTQGRLHPWLLAAVVGATLIGVLLPGNPADKLRALVAGLCAQRPGHSYFLGEMQLPLEARMGGIYAGFLVGVVWLLWAGRERAGLLPPGPLQALLLGFIGLLALDGTNALLYDTGWPALYPPHNALRLATGLLCGLAVALLAAPAVATTLWRTWDLEASVESLRELVGPLVGLALVLVATVSGVAVLYYPLAVMQVGGALLAFTVGNAYALLLLIGAAGQATRWREALNALLAGALVAVGEFLALAMLRHWAETTLGLHWVV